MGNNVVMGTDLSTSMPTLQVAGPLGTAKFAIAWPCAGIESLIIFTAVALLFLTRMSISRRAKIGYFAFGAAVTYLINILRIAFIFTIGMQFGEDSSQVEAFHSYYGPLYGVAWIISYPLLLLASQMAWQKYRNIKASKLKTLQPKPLNPA
jgi:exosortase/archaeosortase family protein